MTRVKQRRRLHDKKPIEKGVRRNHTMNTRGRKAFKKEHNDVLPTTACPKKRQSKPQPSKSTQAHQRKKVEAQPENKIPAPVQALPKKQTATPKTKKMDQEPKVDGTDVHVKEEVVQPEENTEPINGIKEVTGLRNRPFACGVCGKTFLKKVHLEYHTGTHSKVKSFQCSLCKKSYKLKNSLTSHMRIHKVPEHKCSECNKEFFYRGHLTEHLRVHSNEKPFQCSECGRCFRQQGALGRHMVMHGDEKPHVCLICGQGFAISSLLKEHKRWHRLEKDYDIRGLQYECKHCNKVYPIKNTVIALLIRHAATHAQEKEFHCNICDKSFSLRVTFMLHVRTHVDKKPYICNICGKSFALQSYLRLHVKRHSDTNKRIECPECHRKFAWKSVMKVHMRTHTKERPFACSLCDKRYSRRQHLSAHMAVHVDNALDEHCYTSKRPFHCPTCDKSFWQKGHLTEHTRVHTGERPHHCQFCDKKYKLKSHLSVHLRKHTGSNAYACQLCELKFNSRSNLQSHIKSKHCDKKDCECSKCGRWFATNSLLKSHMLVHSSYKPHCCEICGKTYKTRSALKQHSINHLGDEGYKCDVCQTTFCKSSSLERHMQRHQENGTEDTVLQTPIALGHNSTHLVLSPQTRIGPGHDSNSTHLVLSTQTPICSGDNSNSAALALPPYVVDTNEDIFVVLDEETDTEYIVETAPYGSAGDTVVEAITPSDSQSPIDDLNNHPENRLTPKNECVDPSASSEQLAAGNEYKVQLFTEEEGAVSRVDAVEPVTVGQYRHMVKGNVAELDTAEQVSAVHSHMAEAGMDSDVKHESQSVSGEDVQALDNADVVESLTYSIHVGDTASLPVTSRDTVDVIYEIEVHGETVEEENPITFQDHSQVYACVPTGEVYPRATSHLTDGSDRMAASFNDGTRTESELDRDMTSNITTFSAEGQQARISSNEPESDAPHQVAIPPVLRVSPCEITDTDDVLVDGDGQELIDLDEVHIGKEPETYTCSSCGNGFNSIEQLDDHRDVCLRSAFGEIIQNLLKERKLVDPYA